MRRLWRGRRATLACAVGALGLTVGFTTFATVLGGAGLVGDTSPQVVRVVGFGRAVPLVLATVAVGAVLSVTRPWK